ncbi:hypothetical protein [Cellulomonas sp.]|uniref:hypothetical protein n=1 Tax=Cellulomonas sp. TaxID=40001 RepID=UPI001AFEF1F6|nr:hypothetical protein [Cellulomonas sp.]MBO9555587.1 hypothetical protein [Cellulomonas sp.]
MPSLPTTPAQPPDYAALIAEVRRSGCAIEIAGVRITPCCPRVISTPTLNDAEPRPIVTSLGDYDLLLHAGGSVTWREPRVYDLAAEADVREETER